VELGLVGWILGTIAVAGIYGAVKNEPWLSVLTRSVNPRANVPKSIYTDSPTGFGGYGDGGAWDNAGTGSATGSGIGGAVGSIAGGFAGLEAGFRTSLQRMFADAPGRISIGSGFRTFAEQAKLYADWVARKPGQARAAKPGESNHNYGLAADLVFAGGNNGAVARWAHTNAGRYGLVFPMGDEPWHIEPIGADQMRKRR
jgi:hypothetical protein